LDHRVDRRPDADRSQTAHHDRGGVIVSGADDVERLFARVDLATTGVHLSGLGQDFALAAAFLTAARRMGVDHDVIRGSLGCDPFGALATNGVLSTGLDRSLSLVPDAVAWSEANAPGMRALTVSTVPYTLAGATAVHELAFGLATAVGYLRRLVDAGVELPVAARHCLFRMAMGRDLFMGVSKLRALRRLWARVIAACGGGAEDLNAMVHAVTSPRSLTVRDPWVNILRATVESFAAATGTADVVSVLPFDAAVGPSDELARRLAANTHTILRDESNLWRVTDPAAGSWYVERITDELSMAAWSLFQQIESQGGFETALTGGLVHRLLDDALDRKRTAIGTGDDRITGVTSYPNPSETPLQREPADLVAIRDRVARSIVDRSPPTSALDVLSAAAEQGLGDGSIMSAAIAGLSEDATIDEVAAALNGQAGETRITPLQAQREEDAVEEVSR
jgi:methylmalonyl-CoA mutase